MGLGSAALGVLFLVLPLLGLLIRAPWSDLLGQLTAPGVGTALRLSLVSATLATAISMVLGVPVASEHRAATHLRPAYLI